MYIHRESIAINEHRTQQEKLKPMRFLASHGFTGDVVRKVLGGQVPDDMPDQG